MLQNMHITKLIALVCLLTTALLAQVDRAALVGTVSDASGAVVADATVLVESSATGFRRETKTLSNGSYQLPGLPVGSYAVSFTKTGFNSVKVDQVVDRKSVV